MRKLRVRREPDAPLGFPSPYCLLRHFPSRGKAAPQQPASRHRTANLSSHNRSSLRDITIPGPNKPDIPPRRCQLNRFGLSL